MTLTSLVDHTTTSPSRLRDTTVSIGILTLATRMLELSRPKAMSKEVLGLELRAVDMDPLPIQP